MGRVTPSLYTSPLCPAHGVSAPQAAGLSLGTHTNICFLASTMLFLKCSSVANILKSPDFNLSWKTRKWNNTEYTLLWKQAQGVATVSFWQNTGSQESSRFPAVRETERATWKSHIHGEASVPSFCMCPSLGTRHGTSRLPVTPTSAAISQLCEDQREDQPSQVHQPPKPWGRKGLFQASKFGGKNAMEW